MRIPGQITAGDSISWTDATSRDNLGNAITSGDWTLTYILRGPSSLTVTAEANGPGWKTSLTAAQTKALTPGTYYWQAHATNGDNRVTLGQGTTKIVADLAYTNNPAAYDGRSEAEKALAAIDAEISARLTGGMAEEYTIGNRSLKKTSMRDLVELQSRYKTIVTRERQAQKIAQGLGNPRAMFVRF